MSEILKTLIPGVFIAALTALITVRLALWRFHSEKWWERKADLYTRLMEALFHMHAYNRQYRDDYIEEVLNQSGEEQRKARLKDYWRRHETADEEVQKILVMGTFFVSDAVVADLKRLRKEHAAAMQRLNEEGSFTVAESILDSVEDCVEQVSAHAKKDLGIDRRSLSFLKQFLSEQINS